MNDFQTKLFLKIVDANINYISNEYLENIT